MKTEFTEELLKELWNKKNTIGDYSGKLIKDIIDCGVSSFEISINLLLFKCECGGKIAYIDHSGDDRGVPRHYEEFKCVNCEKTVYKTVG